VLTWTHESPAAIHELDVSKQPEKEKKVAAFHPLVDQVSLRAIALPKSASPAPEPGQGFAIEIGIEMAMVGGSLGVFRQIVEHLPEAVRQIRKSHTGLAVSRDRQRTRASVDNGAGATARGTIETFSTYDDSHIREFAPR
jgi:hypothetical protein